MASHKNYQVKRNKSKKGNDIFDKGVNYNKTMDNLTKEEKLMEGVGIW